MRVGNSDFMTSFSGMDVGFPKTANIRAYSSKHKTLNQYWLNVGPPSATQIQHLTIIVTMCRVCWDNTWLYALYRQLTLNMSSKKSSKKNSSNDTSVGQRWSSDYWGATAEMPVWHRASMIPRCRKTSEHWVGNRAHLNLDTGNDSSWS